MPTNENRERKLYEREHQQLRNLGQQPRNAQQDVRASYADGLDPSYSDSNDAALQPEITAQGKLEVLVAAARAKKAARAVPNASYGDGWDGGYSDSGA